MYKSIVEHGNDLGTAVGKVVKAAVTKVYVYTSSINRFLRLAASFRKMQLKYTFLHIFQN